MNIQISEEEKMKLTNCEDVYAIMQKVLLRDDRIDQDKEHFWLVGLAHNNMLIFVELNSLGSVNMTTVNPMNVFRVALIKNASKVILVHNHPSGEVEPSDQDQEVTDRLIQVGKIINVEVVDHMVISQKTYYSFLETGLFRVLQKSLKWVPGPEAVEKVREEERHLRELAHRQGKTEGIEIGLKAGNEAGEKRKAFQMAKKMLSKDKPLEEIVEFTGLTKFEIEKL